MFVNIIISSSSSIIINSFFELCDMNFVLVYYKYLMQLKTIFHSWFPWQVSSSEMEDAGMSGDTTRKENLKQSSKASEDDDENQYEDCSDNEGGGEEESSKKEMRFELTQENPQDAESTPQDKSEKEKEMDEKDLSDEEFTELAESQGNLKEKAEVKEEDFEGERDEENYPAREEEMGVEQEDKQGEEEIDDDKREESASEPTEPDTLTAQSPEATLTIKKIATMEKRRDFGLFIRKTDVMVVGGQAENGNFLDDMLRIHIPTGQVCKADGKLAIPLSGMQVESTAIHQNYLVQFFDAASCFYGE